MSDSIIRQYYLNGLLYELCPLTENTLSGAIVYLPAMDVFAILGEFTGLFSCTVKCNENCPGHTHYRKDVMYLKHITTKEPEFTN
jgi:hypothetical protein